MCGICGAQSDERAGVLFRSDRVEGRKVPQNGTERHYTAAEHNCEIKVGREDLPDPPWDRSSGRRRSPGLGSIRYIVVRDVSKARPRHV